MGMAALGKPIHVDEILNEYSDINVNTKSKLINLMKKILMCSPDYFNVTYDINPWMSNNIDKVNTNLAITQWNQLYFSLKQFIGCQVAVDQVTDQGQLFRTTGIITEASQGQSDGSLTLYKLRLQDPTALWHKRRNSRVFMNKSVRDITKILFTEWQNKSQRESQYRDE